MKKTIIILLVLVWSIFDVFANDGYRLWLKYVKINDTRLLETYLTSIQSLLILGDSETMHIVKNELDLGLGGLLGQSVPVVDEVRDDGTVIVGQYNLIRSLPVTDLKEKLDRIGDEGFVIRSQVIDKKKTIIITANSDIGVLYGTFYFTRQLQTRQNIADLDTVSFPKTKLRMLNHWDMLDGNHEYRGMKSVWDWSTLPDNIEPRYIDYARANASVGINATSLNCVDADPLFLTRDVLIKYAALTKLFRPYGIKMFMSPNFSAPMKLGGLKTADPKDPQVIAWWQNKVKEIYEIIPDFSGFLVKANSEDEPGPADFGKSQAEGANMLAQALEPYNGIVIWRTFVYDYNPQDRAREAYDIFKPLDEIFDDNVVLQVKNGPLDFQPREPFTPLFGAMPNTPLMMELDLLLGWFGGINTYAYMGPLWQEVLMSDTWATGNGSTVARVIDGSLFHYETGGLAGVANIYLDKYWTGNVFGQANWYTFGRMGWDYDLTANEVADEWIRMTFSNDESVINPVKEIMMDSREDIVNYMTPLGLHMIGGWGGFLGPWVNNSDHATWNSPYYHKADSMGIGFDRTVTGSNAVAQYFPPVAEKFASIETCPEKYLLWFHHVPWTYKMKSGNTLWDELCYHYYSGVDGVRNAQKKWESLEGKVDPQVYSDVCDLMEKQKDAAVIWRDGCVLYFQKYSGMPIPKGLEKPQHNLKYYILALSMDKVEAAKMADSIIKDRDCLRKRISK